MYIPFTLKWSETCFKKSLPNADMWDTQIFRYAAEVQATILLGCAQVIQKTFPEDSAHAGGAEDVLLEYFVYLQEISLITLFMNLRALGIFGIVTLSWDGIMELLSQALNRQLQSFPKAS